MPLAVSCPECSYQFRVPDHVAGQRGKCPKCKATFIATRAAETPAAGVPGASAQPKTANVEPETTSIKARTQAIPKPRLLEKMTPPATPDESSAKPLKKAVAVPPTENGTSTKTSASAPSEPPPAPPAAAPARGAPPKLASAKTSAESPPDFAFDSGAAKAKESGAAPVYPHRRAKKSKLPLVIGVGVLLLIGLALVGGSIALSMMNVNPLASLQHPAGGKGNGETTISPPASAADDESSNPDDGDAPIDAQLVGWETLSPALVKIDTIAGSGTQSGMGFLLPNKLVVASYGLFDGAEAAVVTLGDGQRVEVAGVIKRPQHALALLKLEGAAAALPQLALADSTPAPGAVVFIGDEQGATATRIQRRAGISALPAAMRPEMPERMRDNDELQLIEHTSRTATTPDGRTYETPGGAPLVDAKGRVVGMNLALGGDTRKGYAVGVEQLTQLLAASVTEEFAALRVGDIASIDLPDPTTPLDPPAAGDGPLAAELETFQMQREVLAAKNWRPETAADYLALAAFAHFATELTAKIDMLEPAEREAVAPTLLAAIENVADAKWPTADEVAAINTFAAADLPSADTPGVFAYGRCILRPEDFGDKTIDGLPIFAFELTGTPGLVLLPIGENGADIAVNSEWLILGTKDLTQSVTITPPDAPDARTASIVRAKYILGRRTADTPPPLDIEPM